MKKLLLILTLAALPALAQPPTKLQKEVWCASPEAVMETLTGKDYNEVSSWIGQEGESNVTLLQNSKTKTWTVVQFNQKIACVLASGGNSTFVKIEENGNRVPNSKGNL